MCGVLAGGGDTGGITGCEEVEDAFGFGARVSRSSRRRAISTQVSRSSLSYSSSLQVGLGDEGSVDAAELAPGVGPLGVGEADVGGLVVGEDVGDLGLGVVVMGCPWVCGRCRYLGRVG